MDLVLVEWDDAVHAEAGWSTAGDAAGEGAELRMQTVGWLVDQDERRLVLVQSREAADNGPDTTVSAPFVIPTGCVKVLVRLRAPEGFNVA